MGSLSLFTLGCKLNQLESEAVAGAFRRDGWGLASGGEGADLCVVNTCTVTSRAEQKARRLIRALLRDNPRAVLIVTGCYAQMEPGALVALDGGGSGGRLFVIPGDFKSALLELPRFLAGEKPGGGDLSARIRDWAARYGEGVREAADKAARFHFNPGEFSFHSRAFLKIQDGCDNACSYCRVSLARGPSVSLEAETVLRRLQALESRGFGEAVLTGVNINQYRQGERDLGGLLEYLLGATKTIGLRLSSVEPSGAVFPSVFAHPRIRPHFHLSIQSGSQGVLEKMGRPYTPADVEAWVRGLRALRDDPFLACDIITGFPGESPGEFEKTYDMCRRLDFAGIHAFPYSKRPGTAAYRWRDIPGGEAVRRVAALTRLARKNRAAYIGRWQGKTVEAIIEAGGGAGYAAAVSANYLKLLLPCPPGTEDPAMGTALRCRIGDVPAPGKAGRFDALAFPVRTQ
jgi:threonylcarbamoyladenosine tRNA methylthiotransferase MtaB